MSKILIALAILSFIQFSASTTCRDGSQCPGTSTCCLTPQGVGCCPYENANCCGDGLHCCPNGYNCDTTGGRCVKSTTNEFLTYAENAEFFREEATLQKLTKSTSTEEKSPSNILKCLKDITPIVADVKNIINAAKNKKYGELVEDVLKVGKDGKQLIDDCWKTVSSVNTLSFIEFDEAVEPSVNGLLPTGASDLLACINDVQPVVVDIYNIGKCVATSDKDCLQKWFDQITTDGNKLVADCKKVIS